MSDEFAALREKLHGVCEDVTSLKVDMAIVKTELTNHVRELRGDIKEIKSALASLAGLKPNGRDAKTWTMMLAGWLFGMVVMILEFLLRR